MVALREVAALRKQVVVAELLAMVGGQHDQRPLQLSRLFQQRVRLAWSITARSLRASASSERRIGAAGVCPDGRTYPWPEKCEKIMDNPSSRNVKP
jgi:hypothetical protein